QTALGREAGARVEPEAALVGRVAGEADLVQVEAVEGVPAEERDRLGAEALAPLILAADDDAEPRVAVDGVDLVEPAVPDVELALARHDGEHLVAAWIERADPGARARLRVRDGPHGERPPHVRIVQPGVALGGVGLLERAEVDLRPHQVGVAHRTGDRRSRASGGVSRAAPRARNEHKAGPARRDCRYARHQRLRIDTTGT